MEEIAQAQAQEKIGWEFTNLVYVSSSPLTGKIKRISLF